MEPVSVRASRALPPAVIAVSQVGGSAFGSVGPNWDDPAGFPASARSFATATDASRLAVKIATANPAPSDAASLGRRGAPGPRTRRATPSAAKSEVPRIASAHG